MFFFLNCNIQEFFIVANQNNSNIDFWSSITANIGNKIHIYNGLINKFEVIPAQEEAYEKKVLNSDIILDSVTVPVFGIHDVNIISVFSLSNCHIGKYTKIHQDTKLSHYSTLTNNNYLASETNLSFFRILKKKFQEIGNEYEARYFQSLEIEAHKEFLSSLKTKPNRHKIERKKSINTELIFIKVYYEFNKCGRDLFAPLCWIFILWIITASLSYSFDLFNFSKEALWSEKISENKQTTNFTELIFYLVYAFKLILGPIGFLMNFEKVTPNGLSGIFFSTFTQISSTIIWFLYLLQIKKRFFIQ